jgi:hypothetical protein
MTNFLLGRVELAAELNHAVLDSFRQILNQQDKKLCFVDSFPKNILKKKKVKK